MASRWEQAAILTLSEARAGGKPHHLAQLLEEAGGVEGLIDSSAHDGLFDATSATTAGSALNRDRVAHWESALEGLAEDGIRLVTVCDADYPVNLRLVFNRPPYLFVCGEIVDGDQRSVAVVGTRKPSEQGHRCAVALADGLARQGVTVVSGLALGIDIAAHTAAFNAGGRTVAVLGSGVRKVSPASHKGFARSLAASGQGALVSQFLPDMPPQKWTFPERNVVTSGLSLGTAVVEAGETSGARIQAERCLEHGKRLFLIEELVLHREWARAMTERPGVVVVRGVDDILEHVSRELAIPTDISLAS